MYACFIAFILQKLVLPSIPSLHATDGLLQNDAIIFHQAAIDMAAQIHKAGWSAWHLFPCQGLTGNVGVLAGLYALFGVDPALFIPLNAAAHALGATLIYEIGNCLWPGRVGRLGGLVAAILFLTFPSSLQWYSQNHKDAFSISGTLLILWVSLKILETPAQSGIKWFCINRLSFLLAGTALVSFVKPHLVMVITFALGVSFLSILLSWFFRGLLRGRLPAVLQMAGVLAVLGALFLITPKDRDVVGVDSKLYASSEGTSGELGNPTTLSDDGWSWKDSRFLPNIIDHRLKRISLIRVSFARYGNSVAAGSQIDADRTPDDAITTIFYLPRALAIGLFAPFPTSWIVRPNLFKVVGAIETFVWYLIAPGIIFLFARRRSDALSAGVIFCAGFLILLAYTFPNVGTLYRQRYGCLSFFILAGSVGWASVVRQVYNILNFPNNGRNDSFERPPSHGDASPLASGLGQRLDTVTSTGSIVLAITAFGFVGLLIRDLLLFQKTGSGPTLDAYFTATMLPMFFVSFLSQPLGDAVLRPFISLYDRGEGGLASCQEFVRSCVGLFMLVSLVVMVPLLVFPGEILHCFSRNFDIVEASWMLRAFSLIFFFSGVAVIGTVILNAINRSKTAALAQLTVPVTAIISILSTDSSHAISGTIFGMIIGQILNITWISWELSKIGISLRPAWIRCSPELLGTRDNFASLSLVALFTALSIPISYGFAGTLDHGSVSVWAMGNKVTLLFVNMGTVMITAVFLPYLARMLSRHNPGARSGDIYFMLMSGSALAVGICAGIFIFSEPIVGSMFNGETVADHQMGALVWVLRVGGLQVPLLLISTICFKLTAMSKATARPVFVAFIGITITVCLNLFLVGRIGVLGVAVANVAGPACSASLALLTVHSAGMLTRA